MMIRITIVAFIIFLLLSCNAPLKISLTKSFTDALYTLTDVLIQVQDLDSSSATFGALYCKSCNDYHTRASEAILPFAVSFRQSGNEKYFKSAVLTGEWLIDQQQTDGSWYETPSSWTGTTSDQVLSLSTTYTILKKSLNLIQQQKWESSIKRAGDWLVENMNHEFASINYCATSTAALMLVYKVIPDSAYIYKAKDLAMLVASKFDGDYFLTGEGNRIRGTKYGVDFGYNLDMSLWGLGLYSKLSNDNFIDNIVEESLKRHLYFIYPDGSTDGSWGVRSSKWTTYGSVTADGCQILFSLYADKDPAYRTAAIKNLNYFMQITYKGLLSYGPHYSKMFNEPPCIYPTFCRAKNLALSILFGNHLDGDSQNIPTQKIGWMKYFPTLDISMVRTKNFMTTITGYRYKDIRRGADFKYMHRPTGGSITNLWVKDYGYLQASSQTEYHRWEMNYPEGSGAISITPRIEFTDSNAYYTNLYEFDSHMKLNEENGAYVVEARGELKDRNRWEGGVAYILTHTVTDNSIEKNIKLRFKKSNYLF